MHYVFAILAALSFALAIHLQGVGAKGISGLRAGYLSVVAMTLLVWAISPFMIEWHWWRSPAVWLFILGGMLVPTTGQVMQVMSIQRVGPSVTSAMGGFMPIFAILPAILFLDDRLGLQGAIGVALLISGLLVASWKSKRVARNWPLIFLVFPLVASMARGFSQPIVKSGYTTLPEPFFATLVMATTAVILLFLFVRLRDGSVPGLAELGTRKALLASGALNGIGIFCVQAGIKAGPVSSVAPLVATTPFWVWVLSALIFRSQKSGPREFAMAALVILGGTLVILR